MRHALWSFGSCIQSKSLDSPENDACACKWTLKEKKKEEKRKDSRRCKDPDFRGRVTENLRVT